MFSRDGYLPALKIDYDFGLSRHPDLLVYASAAKGYRVGGANAPLPPTCGPALESLGISIPPGATVRGLQPRLRRRLHQWPLHAEPICLATARRVDPGGKGAGLPGISPWTFMIAGVQNFDVAGCVSYIRLAYEYSCRNLDTPVQNAATSQYDANLPVRPATRFVRVRAGVDVNQVNPSLFVGNRFDTSPRLTRAHNIRTTPLYTITTFRPRTAGITATYRY